MNKLYIKFYSSCPTEENIYNYPDYFPWIVQVKDSTQCIPDNDETVMTLEEYEQYLAIYKDEMDAFIATLGNNVDLLEHKKDAIQIIQDRFYYEMGNNESHSITECLDSNGNKIVMNNRRNECDNDLQNIQNVLYMFELNPSLTSTQIKDFYNQIHTVTKEQLKTIILGMIMGAQALYQKYWLRKIEVSNANSPEEIDIIINNVMTEGL